MTSKPSLFIGSSTEGLGVAYKIQSQLQFTAEPTVWTQGIFELSRSALESLLAALPRYQFALFVMTPDDITTLRSTTSPTPRDNVVFELGLFMGHLGAERTFFVVPRGAELHLPTDLLGIRPAEYDAHRNDGNLGAALGPACHEISQAIQEVSQLSYGDAPLIRARALESRLSAVVIRRIRVRDIPTDFPMPRSLDNLALAELANIAKLLGEEMTFFPTFEVFFAMSRASSRGTLASALDRLALDRELDKLETLVEQVEGSTLAAG